MAAYISASLAARSAGSAACTEAAVQSVASPQQPRRSAHVHDRRAFLGKSLHATTVQRFELSRPWKLPAARQPARGLPRASAEASSAAEAGGGADEEWDCVVIGSGIGGLVCAGMLGLYGKRVLVCESHSVPGGAAHSFERNGFHFDSGPSFFCGLSQEAGSTNPLRQALELLGEADSLQYVQYDRWDYHIGTPEDGPFRVITDAEGYRAEVARFSPQGARELAELEEILRPYHEAACAIPAVALRPDPAILKVLFPKYAAPLAKMAPLVSTIQGPASAVIDRVVKDPFLRRLLDLECFVLSGLPADGTIMAEFAFMMGERAQATVEYPLGGSQAIVDALVRGIRRHGGEVRCGAHVARVAVDGGRATGVVLRSGRRVAAPLVVSNASVWDTAERLLGPEDVPAAWRREAAGTPTCGSFMHLHAGIRADGLPEELLCHHCVVLDPAAPVDAPGNVVIISIPSLYDPSMAPAGHHAVHAYTAGNEPWAQWAGLERGTAEYEAKKAERAECLWRALERVIPDIRERTTVSLVGTPVTHQRFLRRHEGTYGPAIVAGEAQFAGPKTPVAGLLRCGDSCLPGIGVPAVAASGIMAAHAVVGVPEQRRLLARLRS